MNLRRKRMILMHDVWYGYNRIASGNPLTLQAAKRLRKLTICGNAVQDGTPSPDAPVEVQLCGDRTANLLDVDLVFSGSINNSSIRYTELYIEPNKVYTLLTNVPKATASICDVFIKGGSDPSFSNSKHGASDGFPRSATTGDDGCLLVGIRDSLSQNDFHDGTYIIMLIEGAYTAETMPAYEPYGYKVSGHVEGVNLFDTDKSKWQTQTYKYFKIPSNGTTTLQIKLKSGKNIPSELYIGFTNTGYPSSAGIDWIISNGAYTKGGADLMYSSKPYISMYPPYLFDKLLDIFDIMLVQGSYTAETMPPYEPYREPQTFNIYTPQQLAKVGDTADTVVLDFDNKTAELRKNVGSMVVSDGYNGATSITDELVRFYHTTNPNRKVSDNSNVVDIASDIFEADTFTNLGFQSTKKQYVIAGNSNTSVFNVRVPKIAIGGDTAEAMNAWAANHPATVYYVLATPVTTDITSLQQWDAMPQVKGTVTLTLSAEVPPSGAEAIYYSKERNTE